MEPSINKIRLAGPLWAVMTLLVVFLLMSARPSAWAAEVAELAPVVVVGTVKVEATGKSEISKDQINALPSADANIEELLKLMPGVQASDEDNASFHGGEIKPPLISISGSRPYESSYLIDGMGNNSLLDPLENNPNKISNLPGHPQEIFLNSNLIQTVTVYDNNIPARYGGFSGGVVDVETVDPGTVFSGDLKYRTTRSSWTEFHVHKDDRDDFHNSTSDYRQPRFSKHDVGLSFDIPITDKTGVLASYQRLYSEIPLTLVDQNFDQERESENFLLKVVHRPSALNKITAQVIHNPYRGIYFTKDTLNSEFTIKGGGTSGKIGYEHDFASGRLTLDAGYRESENSRDAPIDFLNWSNSASKDWGVLLDSRYSKEGGFGDIETGQKTLEVNLDWSSRQFDTEWGAHLLNFGVSWALAEATYHRPEDSYSYSTSVPARVDPPALVSDPSIACAPGDPVCIDGEQYLTTRALYAKGYSQADIETIAIYGEDNFVAGRLEIRPGVRISYNDFMKNTNVAPRFSGAFDLWANGNTKLVGGWNRYYSRTLLTYKLREGIEPTRFERRTDNNSPWTEYLALTTKTEYSKLETPYSDEIVAGVMHQVLGGTADLRYVHRENQDQFARERDPFGTTPYRYYRLNNNGRSKYQSVRLKWERQWEKQFLSLNATYQETTSSNENYDETLEFEDLDDRVWYGGELLFLDELPRGNFNRPWVASLIYSVELPYGFQFTNTTNYRSGYRNLEDSGQTINVAGVDYDVYAEFSYASATLFNWQIDWTPSRESISPLTITLEMLNVFNRQVVRGAGDYDDNGNPEYELGRQIWLGIEYRF